MTLPSSIYGLTITFENSAGTQIKTFSMPIISYDVLRAIERLKIRMRDEGDGPWRIVTYQLYNRLDKQRGHVTTYQIRNRNSKTHWRTIWQAAQKFWGKCPDCGHYSMAFCGHFCFNGGCPSRNKPEVRNEPTDNRPV